MQTRASIGISCGNGIDLIITQDDRLCMVTHQRGAINIELDFGKATLRNIERLQQNLERFKIHAVEG